MVDESLAEALRKAAPRVASHMNEDHAASLRAYLGHYGGLPDGDYDVWMTDCDTRGFVLKYRVRDGTLTAPTHQMVAPFPRPITSAAQLRTFAVEMHHTAFKALGVGFRLRHGYYVDAARHASAGISKALLRRLPLPAGGGRLVWAAAAALVGVFAVGVVRRLTAKPPGLVASNPRWIQNPRHAKG